MSVMEMTFFTSTTTPLFATPWTPSSTGQYAGTCLFLVVLAALFRVLFALRTIQERRWQLMESKRRYVIAGAEEDESKRSVSSDKSNEGAVVVVKNNISGVRPWRTTQDVPRACFDVVIAGVGYLLMIAVMSLNVGYFISVLGGTFLGTLVAGRFSAHTSH